MYLSQRKMLLSQFFTKKTAHLVFFKKYSCLHCSLYCPDECKLDSDTYHALSPNPPPPPVYSSPKSQMPSFLIIMLCVLGAALVFLTYLTILGRKRAFGTSRRRNLGSDGASPEDLIDSNDDGPVVHPIWYINTVGLQQSVIDSITVFKYKKDECLIESSECSVCLSEFQDDETLRLLPKCDHAFHVHCIDTWLRTHKNCPLCRAPVVKESSGDVADGMNIEELVSGEDSVENVAQIEGNDLGINGIDHIAIGVEEIGFPMPNHGGKLQEMSKSSKNEAIRVLSDLAGRFVRAEEELQPMRRSVSMDYFSASRIDARSVAQFHEEGCSKIQDFEVTKQISEEEAKTEDGNSSMDGRRKSYSFRLSLQKVPVCMKRSFSSSGKFSLPTRHRRSQESLEISDLGSKASSSGPLT